MIAAEAAARRRRFPVGWYGKIPAAGDFVARRIPPAFSEAWDRWLQGALAGTRQRLGARWRDDFLSMPVWRFVFSPGLVTPSAWAGLMLPSVDAVGRYFPLALASALPPASLDPVATTFAAQAWFDEMEDIALSAIVPGADYAAIEAAIAARPFREEWLRYAEGRGDKVSICGERPQMLCVALPPRTGEEIPATALRRLAERLSDPAGAWLAEPSDVFGRSLLLCEALPAAEQLCGMMDGRWLEHGWARQEVGPVS